MSSFPKVDYVSQFVLRLTRWIQINRQFGCRQANPDICGYCYIEGICAFVVQRTQSVNIHLLSGKKIYSELKEGNK